MRGARLLTLLAGKRRYNTTFATLGGWRQVLGAVEASGGMLVASALAANGDERIANGDFAIAGAGDADVFASWIETAGAGQVLDETELTHSGGHAVKLVKGLSGATSIYQSAGTVREHQTYQIQFWTAGDGANAGQYGVYDATGATWIKTATSTGVTASEYALVTDTVAIPASCEGIRIYFYAPPGGAGRWACFDDVSIQPMTAQALVPPSANGGRASTWLEAGVVLPASGSVSFGVSIRGTDEANYWLWRFALADNELQLVKVEDYAETVVAHAPVAWVADATHTFRAQTSGATFSAWLDGVLTIVHIDTTDFNATATDIGFQDDGAVNGALDWLRLEKPRVAVPATLTLPQGLQTGESSYIPAIMIMFDGGRVTDHSRAYPLMAAHGMRGTSYITSGTISASSYMTPEQLQELDAAGWVIGNHTETHTNLTTLTQEQVEAELIACRDALIAAGVGDNVLHVAYPYSARNATVDAAMAAYGALTGRSSVTTEPYLVEDVELYKIPCVGIDASVDLATAKGYVSAAVAAGKVAALLFHNLVTEPPIDVQWNVDDFEALLTYIAQLALPTLTIAEFYALRSAQVTIAWEKPQR